MTRLANGQIVYPNRGSPPKQCPEGYKRDPGDDYICLPIVLPCIYRGEKELDGCCRVTKEMSCAHFEKTINAGDCVGCEVRKEVS